MGDIVLVAAWQVEASGVGVEQALVPAQQPLERELIASLRGLDQAGVVPQAAATPAGVALGGVRPFIRGG